MTFDHKSQNERRAFFGVAYVVQQSYESRYFVKFETKITFISFIREIENGSQLILSIEGQTVKSVKKKVSDLKFTTYGKTLLVP